MAHLSPIRAADPLSRLVGDLIRSDESTEVLKSSTFDLSALVAADVEGWLVTNALRTAHLADAAATSDSQFDSGGVSTVGRLLREAVGE